MTTIQLPCELMRFQCTHVCKDALWCDGNGAQLLARMFTSVTCIQIV